MSHHSSKPKICPNCGYPAVENYCAQCGQETHLHKDTFGALIVHFAGHYLHYDSKFWQTLRALWFSPGMLTTAYWEEKRMRYIPPISLYIFVSFVFFFTSSLMGNGREENNEAVRNAIVKENLAKEDSIARRNSGIRRGAADTARSKSQGKIIFEFSPTLSSPVHTNYTATADGKTNYKDDGKGLESAMDSLRKYPFLHALNYKKLKKNHPDLGGYFREEVTHLWPKVFFFLIPCMALVLKLLFFRRKDLFYVNHVIFSLHYHALWFSLFWLGVVYPFEKFENLVWLLVFVGTTVYMVMALKNVYQIKTFRAILYTTAIATFYVFFLVIALLALMCIILAMACR